jgi:Ca-activated chloride channel family protein
MSELAQFHFLRPGWLGLLLPVFLLIWIMLRRRDETRAWRNVISPGLLPHLLIEQGGEKSRLHPVHVLLACWLIGVIALAGPAWHREPSPFTEDRAALFIVMEVTPGMLARDIQPSRLQRSVQKVTDLLELRPGTKTGLVAYAGSAHLVMPLTSDASIIAEFAGQLDPSVMPVPGDEPARALQLAQDRLIRSKLPGSIVWISDGIDSFQLADLKALGRRGGAAVHILAMAAGPDVVPPADSPPAPALDRDTMQAAASALGGDLTLPTADDADVRRLNAKIDRSLASAPAQEGDRWKDNGYLLLPLLALLMLAFFRRGGAVALQ